MRGGRCTRIHGGLKTQESDVDHYCHGRYDANDKGDEQDQIAAVPRAPLGGSIPGVSPHDDSVSDGVVTDRHTSAHGCAALARGTPVAPMARRRVIDGGEPLLPPSEAGTPMGVSRVVRTYKRLPK